MRCWRSASGAQGCSIVRAYVLVLLAVASCAGGFKSQDSETMLTPALEMRKEGGDAEKQNSPSMQNVKVLAQLSVPLRARGFELDDFSATAGDVDTKCPETLGIEAGEQISFPAGGTRIPPGFMTDCNKFTWDGIFIPDGYTRIEDRAFRRCYGCKGTISLPSTLEYIGEYAFAWTPTTEVVLRSGTQREVPLQMPGGFQFLNTAISSFTFSGPLWYLHKSSFRQQRLKGFSWTNTDKFRTLTWIDGQCSDLLNKVFNYCSEGCAACSTQCPLEPMWGEDTWKNEQKCHERQHSKVTMIASGQECTDQASQCPLMFSDHYRNNKDSTFKCATESSTVDNDFENWNMNDRGTMWTAQFMQDRKAEGYKYIQRLSDNDRNRPPEKYTTIPMDSSMLWGYLFSSTTDVTFHACTSNEHPTEQPLAAALKKPCDYMSCKPCLEQQQDFQATGETVETDMMFDQKQLTCYSGTLPAGVHLLSAFRISSVFYK